LLREEMKEPQNGSVDRLPSKLQEKQVSQWLESYRERGKEAKIYIIEHEITKVCLV
jgi:hypothetical protein